MTSDVQQKLVKIANHFTADMCSFCSIPHGPASTAPNMHSDQLQNRHSDLQDSVFWTTGVPS